MELQELQRAVERLNPDLVFRRYAVVYGADHPVKELKITEVRFADR